MKRIYLIPNVITAFALTCGLFVIFRTTVFGFSENLFNFLQGAAILLLLAALADVADGAVARLIKAESEFGIYFDSLSDAINFGVAPPLLILKSLSGSDHNLSPLLIFFLITAAMMYALCGVLRLVRYNVQKSQEAKGLKISNRKGHFTGLPIPAAASCALSAGLILLSPFLRDIWPVALEIRAIILSIVLVILGYFMISRWKFPSVKTLHFRVPTFYLILLTGIFAVVVLYGIVDYFPEIYFAVSWLYLLVSWVLSIVSSILGKRAKRLEDFEPEDED